MKISFIFCFIAITNLLVNPIFYEDSFAENLSPRQQWKQFADPHMLTCKEGFVLLQKNNGYPTCVTPSTYLKLIDRGFTKFDFTIILHRHDMIISLIENFTSNQNLMSHWHEMMLKNPNVTSKTILNWISQMKENPELLKNMLGPMTSDPSLRKKMIDEMKKHPVMEVSLKQNTAWMDSVHGSMMDSGMAQGKYNEECLWCPQLTHHNSMDYSMRFSHSDRMMDLMHHMWINDQMNQEIYQFMLKSPEHMALMSEQMMSEILNPMMDDPQLREQMIDLMLKHPGFMNSIRHNN